MRSETQFCPGFELGSPISFHSVITITISACPDSFFVDIFMTSTVYRFDLLSKQF